MNARRDVRRSVARVESVVVLVVVAAAGAHGARAATLPKDPCALLKPAEVQAALAPDVKVGAGVVDRSALPLGTACRFTWGPRTPKWGDSEVTIMLIDVSKGFQGMSPDLIAQGVLLKAKGKDAGPNDSVIPGVGDAAAFTYKAGSYNATAEAYLKSKDVHLSVEYHGDSLSHKEQVISLLKTVAGRL